MCVKTLIRFSVGIQFKPDSPKLKRNYLHYKVSKKLTKHRHFSLPLNKNRLSTLTYNHGPQIHTPCSSSQHLYQKTEYTETLFLNVSPLRQRASRTALAWAPYPRAQQVTGPKGWIDVLLCLFLFLAGLPLAKYNSLTNEKGHLKANKSICKAKHAKLRYEMALASQMHYNRWVITASFFPLLTTQSV